MHMQNNPSAPSIEERLERFARYVFAQANAKKNAINEAVTAQKNQQIHQTETACAQQIQQDLIRRQQRAARESGETMGRLRLQTQKELAEHRAALEDAVFAEIVAQLHAFVQSDAYYTWLLAIAKSAIDAVGTGPKTQLRISAADIKYKKQLAQDTGCSVDLLDNDEDIIGGVRAENPLARMLCTDTLALRLAQQREGFSSYWK